MMAAMPVQGTADGRFAPVRHYWPGFRAQATVRHLLSHQAGVVMLDQPAPSASPCDLVV
jgi:CubicO group peptidase (beta-lactamase class C family)